MSLIEKLLPKPKPPTPWARLETAVENVEHLLRRVLHNQETAACAAAERHEQQMATLDTLAQQVAAARGDAAAEAVEVKTKLDELAALITELQQNANDPAKVEQLSVDLEATRSEIQGIFTGTSPGAKK